MQDALPTVFFNALGSDSFQPKREARNRATLNHAMLIVHSPLLGVLVVVESLKWQSFF